MATRRMFGQVAAKVARQRNGGRPAPTIVNAATRPISLFPTELGLSIGRLAPRAWARRVNPAPFGQARIGTGGFSGS